MNNSEALSQFINDKIDLKDISIEELKTQAEIFKNNDKIDIQNLSIDELKNQAKNLSSPQNKALNVNNTNNEKIDIKNLSTQELQKQAAIYKQNLNNNRKQNIASYTYKSTASNNNTANSNNQNNIYHRGLGDVVSDFIYNKVGDTKDKVVNNITQHFANAEEAYKDGALV